MINIYIRPHAPTWIIPDYRSSRVEILMIVLYVVMVELQCQDDSPDMHSLWEVFDIA